MLTITFYGKIFSAIRVFFFNVYFTLKSSELDYAVVYLIASILGLTVSPFIYTFHMLDIVTRVTLMRLVLTSVTKHFGQLVLTALMGMLIIHIWTAIAFIFLVTEPTGQPFNSLYTYGTGNIDCSDYARCLLSNVAFGFQSPPLFIGDYATEEYSIGFRAVVVFLYNFFIVVVLVAIVTGIIIDTFVELRHERLSVESAQKTKCYICGIAAAEFERNGNGFSHHRRNEHSVWDYCYCRLYLEEKEESEYTGVETYISKQIKENKPSVFFPIARAICINRIISTVDNNVVVNNKLDEIKGGKTKTDEQLDDLNDMIKQLKDLTISQQNELKTTKELVTQLLPTTSFKDPDTSRKATRLTISIPK